MPFSRSRRVPGHSTRRSTMHRNHPQLQSSVFSRQLSETTTGRIPAPAPKNDPVLDHLDSAPPGPTPRLRRGTMDDRWHAQHTPLNTSATIAGGPVPHEEPSRDTDHIRSDLRPRRAQRRTRT